LAGLVDGTADVELGECFHAKARAEQCRLSFEQ
jgi:hypothetical protein